MKNTLIVGWHQESINLFNKIREFPALGYEVKGFITLSRYELGVKYKNVPLLGELNRLSALIEELDIKEILIAIQSKEQIKLTEIIKICERRDVRYRIVSEVYDAVFGNVTRAVFKDVFKHRELGLRRVSDLFGALLLMIFFFPMFVVIATLIKIESKDSIFISQLRVGKNGKLFRIYKFRCVKKGDEELEEAFWKDGLEARRTKIGEFLQQTRMEDLPQLLNVLKGDMSFIGPKPESPLFVDTIKQQIPLYTNRLRIKPGVTGWAQINWHHEETIEDVKEKLKYDIDYINGHTLKMEWTIFFSSLSALLFGKEY